MSPVSEQVDIEEVGNNDSEPPRESWRLHSLRGWSDGKDKQVSQDVRDRAVRLVLDHRGEYASEWQAITSIAPKVGVHVDQFAWSTCSGSGGPAGAYTSRQLACSARPLLDAAAASLLHERRVHQSFDEARFVTRRGRRLAGRWVPPGQGTQPSAPGDRRAPQRIGRVSTGKGPLSARGGRRCPA